MKNENLQALGLQLVILVTTFKIGGEKNTMVKAKRELLERLLTSEVWGQILVSHFIINIG